MKAICVDNKGYEVSLEKGKAYETTPVDGPANLVRVIDESGEGYLYPSKRFKLNVEN